MDEILEGQTDIFELLGPNDLETPSPSINEKSEQPSAEENTQ